MNVQEEPVQPAMTAGEAEHAQETAAAAEAPPESARRVERLPGVHLKLKLGNQLILRFLCVDKRYEAKVVGYEPYAYSIAQVRLPQEVLAKLGQNPGVVAQLNAGGTLYGFKTEVVNKVNVPAPLVFLSHPASVERLVLRRTERLDVTLPAKIHGAYGEHDVLLLDIAPSGCSFTARCTLKSPLREAKPGDRVVLHCDLACGQPLMAPIHLRRVAEHNGRVTMGGQFVDLTDDAAQVLAEYLERLQPLMGE
ncbi:protein YcgR [Humidesulfovibrio mexicanus]|uniref:Protein YcgR n=1 Tax=Humidesulfovibrio mexicanus TaxID=147047 RepID=A0A239AYX2_9BACT|nr:PilZ domain-containing protein [Humidesulfovibrio mexicanus]SNS00561.1 protein YcgR [Humidesulfovibrio mexicanus]